MKQEKKDTVELKAEIKKLKKDRDALCDYILKPHNVMRDIGLLIDAKKTGAVGSLSVAIQAINHYIDVQQGRKSEEKTLKPKENPTRRAKQTEKGAIVGFSGLNTNNVIGEWDNPLEKKK